jgi:hypothetical protein
MSSTSAHALSSRSSGPNDGLEGSLREPPPPPAGRPPLGPGPDVVGVPERTDGFDGRGRGETLLLHELLAALPGDTQVAGDLRDAL